MLITILLIFLAGVAFAQWGIPLLDSLLSLILQKIEMRRGLLAEKITESSVKIEKMRDEPKEKPPINQIGFALPDYEEDEDCDDD